MHVGASVFSSTDQVIPSGVETQVLFDTAQYDTDAIFDPTTSSLVIKTPGRYLLQGRLFWAFDPAEGSAFTLNLKRGTGYLAFDNQHPSASGFSQDVSLIVRLSAGDVITLTASQNTGTDAASFALAGVPFLQAELLAP
ncbi:hypothetical protein [Streptomyces sp. NPDC089799]|uniref:hypothetical protein n=1 Tax=Streptomyces sp. NPDC089799 TaxID=3155066 RepID=UPI0034344F1B